jgi:RNA polymerase sigma factor (sigma-70 family)
MRGLYDEHAAALRRYAVRLTGDAARAEDVVQETLLRAWQHPEVTDDHDRSARAWLFTVARNVIIDERRSAGFRNESTTRDPERTHDHAGPDQVDSALDSVVAHRQMKIRVGGLCAHGRAGGPGVLRSIGKRLGHHVIGGDFDGLGYPSLNRDVEANRDHRAAGQRLQRGGQPASRNDRGINSMGYLAIPGEPDPESA